MESQQTFPASFGELLKTFRKRKRLTQKQLAQQLGVHANTISSWELGTYLPATRGLVLELARHLALDEQETRQLLEASLTALSPHWQVPFQRNPLFTASRHGSWVPICPPPADSSWNWPGTWLWMSRRHANCWKPV